MPDRATGPTQAGVSTLCGKGRGGLKGDRARSFVLQTDGRGVLASRCRRPVGAAVGLLEVGRRRRRRTSLAVLAVAAAATAAATASCAAS